MAPSAAQWEVLHQTTSLHLDVRQQALRGRTELRLRLPPRTTRLSLHCASQCVVDQCSLTVDGSSDSHRLSWRRPCASLLDVPVPRRFETRDLPSFLSALGGTLDAADRGELEVSLLPESGKMQQATLAIEYRVDAIRGGVHFPRATRDAAPMVAHTAAEAGAVRFWMPCVDRVESRCTFTLFITTEASYQVLASGTPIPAARIPATSTPGDASLHTLGFELDHPVMASQVGFVVGKLLLADHPTLPAWALALGSLSASPSHVKQMWQQLVDASRLLPDLRAFLSSQLLELPEAAGAPPQAARRRAAEPFSHHALVALQGAKELFSSFAGLVIIDAAQLHPQQAIEPARKLRLLLARAFGRAWLLSGVWLDDWIEAWLLMAMEGRLLHAYTQHAFGRNEATFRLHQERRALCDDLTCLPLVPSLEELERCGWRMHAEQVADEHRMRKAAYVLSMVERMMLRVEHGASNFRQVLCNIAVFPPLRDDPDRIRSTDDFIGRCRAKGVDLEELKEHWIVGGRPCPTIEANFAYIKRKNLIELVVGAPSSKDAKLCDKLCVGWGELDASGASIPKEKSIRLTEGLQLVHLDVDARRSRKRGVEGTEGEGGESVQESNVPLLWLRIDPALEYPLRVIWTGRRDEPNWTGQPEFMCREQLERTIDVVSQIEAAMALSTFRTHTAVDALYAALSKPTNYYRVRVAAAASLAQLSRASALLDAKDKLIDYLVDEYFVDEHLAPNDFSDLSAYAVRKAVVEAIGNCRDDEGRAHPECILTLLSMLDENDNSRNDFEDGYALGATIRSLTGAVCAGCEEYVDELMQNINRHLQLDELQPSHDCILTCCCLQALVELELTGLREPQLELYEYHEQHGETARLRLTAADCLLRLRLLQPAAGEPSDSGDGAEQPSRRCVLTLALQLADKRVHTPQEELLLWQVLLLLLRTHADAVARQKELLSDKDSSEAVAATRYLWHRMNVEAHGHMRLRLALVSVWRELFGDGAPACLPSEPPITYSDILVDYVPLKKSQADQRETEKAEAIKRRVERDKQKELERQSAEKRSRQVREEREAEDKRKLAAMRMEQLKKEQENS